MGFANLSPNFRWKFFAPIRMPSPRLEPSSSYYSLDSFFRMSLIETSALIPNLSLSDYRIYLGLRMTFPKFYYGKVVCASEMSVCNLTHLLPTDRAFHIFNCHHNLPSCYIP